MSRNQESKPVVGSVLQMTPAEVEQATKEKVAAYEKERAAYEGAQWEPVKELNIPQPGLTIAAFSGTHFFPPTTRIERHKGSGIFRLTNRNGPVAYYAGFAAWSCYNSDELAALAEQRKK